MDLVGEEPFGDRGHSVTTDEWMLVPKIALVVHADATARNAAPAIISEYLETLTRRTEEFLRQRCFFQEIAIVPPLSKPGNFSQELNVQGQRLRVPYEIVILFSSRETVGPEKIGEATMMTQMTGTVIENSALAEVGIFRVSDSRLVFYASGQGIESLEQLDVPMGKNRPSTASAQDLLRARAGQQALDRALEHLGAVCQNGTPGRSDVTGSFQTVGRVRSPAP
jgi:hypothetical protein